MRTLYFSLWFLLSFYLSLFPRLISAVADWMSTILAHMVWQCEFMMQVQTRLSENTGRKKNRKIRHFHTIAQLCRAISSQLRHISTIGKKLVKQQCVLQTSSQYGELRPISGLNWSGSMGHPT